MNYEKIVAGGRTGGREKSKANRGHKIIFTQMMANLRKIDQYVFVIIDYAFIHVRFD